MESQLHTLELAATHWFVLSVDPHLARSELFGEVAHSAGIVRGLLVLVANGSQN